MRKARFAEWLLRSVTDQDRAASTVGDLLESSLERGQLWFWSNVLRTVGSQMWQGVAVQPQGALWTAFQAWWRTALYLLMVRVLRTICFELARNGHWPINASQMAMWFLVVTFVVQFLMGRWIAMRAPNHVLRAVLALCLFSWIFGGIWEMALVTAGIMPPMTAPLLFLQTVGGLFGTWPFVVGSMVAPRSATR